MMVFQLSTKLYQSEWSLLPLPTNLYQLKNTVKITNKTYIYLKKIIVVITNKALSILFQKSVTNTNKTRPIDKKRKEKEKKEGKRTKLHFIPKAFVKAEEARGTRVQYHPSLASCNVKKDEKKKCKCQSFETALWDSVPLVHLFRSYFLLGWKLLIFILGVITFICIIKYNHSDIIIII